MDPARVVVRATVLIIVAVTLLSGPLVGVVDLTTEPDREGLGRGTASISVVSVPTEDLRFERARYGTGTYTLRVPPAEIYVESVSGNPVLTYKLRLPEMGYVRTSIHALGPEQSGTRLSVELARHEVDPAKIERDSYRGELLLTLRGARTQVIHRQNVTVAVVE